MAKEYKCPNCGGAVEYSGAAGKLVCPFCDSEFEITAFGDNSGSTANEIASDEIWNVGEDGLYTFVCKSCGGEIVGSQSTASMSCPYCDNPIVMTDQVQGSLKPDLIIPFKLDKRAAKDKLRDYVEGKRLLPEVFKSENHIDEIKGVYVPFWLFDVKVRSDVSFAAEKEHRRGDDIEIEHFVLDRMGTMSFRGVPVDASSQMDDNTMDSLEPFDVRSAKEFSAAYLAGYVANSYDVSREESFRRAEKRIKKSAVEEIASTVRGFDSVSVKNSRVEVLDTTARYALYPVWILNTQWDGKKYQFAMNGQTGKFIGDLPCDDARAMRYQLISGAIVAVVVFVVLFVIGVL